MKAGHNEEKRNVVIQMRITPTLKEAAQKRADEEGRSLSNYIEWLILKDLKEHDK